MKQGRNKRKYGNAAHIVKVNVYVYVSVQWVVISNGFLQLSQEKCFKATDLADFFGTPLLIVHLSLAFKFYSSYKDLDYPLCFKIRQLGK